MTSWIVTATSIMYFLYLERQNLQNHSIEPVSMATEVSYSKEAACI